MNEKKSIGLAVTSMILGIISLLFGCCFWYITIPAAILAVILSSVSLSKKMGGSGMAIAGLITSIVSLVPAIIVMITGSSLMAFGKASTDDVKDNDDNKPRISVSDSSQSVDKDCISVSSWYLDKDYSDNDVVVIEYSWTNTSDKAASFSFSITDKAYQNGVELDSAFGCDSIDSGDTLKEVQPGATQKVKSAFILDDTSDVNIIVSEFLWGDELINETIDIDIDEQNSSKITKNNNTESENDNPNKDEKTDKSDLSADEIENMIQNGDYSLVTPDFKETMDSYEAFCDDYVKFMQDYSSGEMNVMDMLEDYTKMLTDMSDWSYKIEEIDTNNLSPADSAYYTLVTLRVSKKLLDVVL